MVFNLLKVEIKRHLAFLGGLILIELIFSFLVLLDFYKYKDIAFIISTIIWLIVPIYIFIDLYRDFYIGDNILLHMLPMKKINIFLIKTMIFSTLLTILWATNLLFQIFSEYGIYETKIIQSSKPFEGLMFFILSRVVSIISGVIILELAILLGKLFKNVYLGSGCIATVLILMTFLIYQVMKSNFINQENVMYTMVNQSNIVYKQYAGLITFFVISNEEILDIAQSIHWNNVIANFVGTIIGFLIIKLILKSKKYDLIGK